MSFLGLTHETPLIQAIYDQLVEDGRLLAEQRRIVREASDLCDADVARGGEAGEPEPVVATVPDADLRADACRADALAARVLGRHLPDGGVILESASTVVSVEVVVDLDTFAVWPTTSR